MYKTTGIIVLLLISVVLFPAISAADIMIIEKTAVVGITGEKEETRQKAIKQAVKSAFEEVLVDTMKKLPAGQVNNQKPMLRNAAYTNMDSYVPQRRVVSEKALPDNRYEVKVRTKVDRGALKRDLEKLLAAKRNPRVLFMIAEKSAGQDTLSYWWGKGGKSTSLGISENQMIKIFNKKGFTCVDAIGLVKKAKVDDDKRTAMLEDSTALLFGQMGGAEIVVVGKASAADGGSLTSSGNFRSVQVDLSVKVLRVDTGETIASDSVWKTAPHISLESGSSKGFRQAVDEISGKLISQITSKWSRDVKLYTTVQVDVSSITYTQLIELKNILKRDCGCLKVHERSFSDDSAQLSVELKGDAQSLAKKIALQNSTHLPISIKGVSQNAIKLAVQGS